MKSIGESLVLYFIYLVVLLRKMIEEIRVRRRFYGIPSLQRCDLNLKYAYRGINPYKISKQFLLQKGEKEVDVYGETPLTTLAHIAKECEIGPSDSVLELGSGRGRGAFFLSLWTGCTVKAVEWIPPFVKVAKEIADLCKITTVSFHCSDITEMETDDASCVYFCGTCFDDVLIHKIAQKLERLKKGARVISVSFPLTEYSSSFTLKKQFQGSFFWGKTEIYLQERK
jgi:SAM-dependent methyltransferase